MLKEKIGQMLVMGFKGTQLTPQDAIIKAIHAKQLGGVILFASNIVSPEQLQTLTQALRHAAQTAGLPNFLISLDYEGGTVKRLNPEQGFPPTLTAATIGARPDSEVTNQARAMALTLKNAGINLNFAPTLDVNVNPSNPIIGLRERSFSVDAKRVAQCADIFTQAYLDENILCAYKHFPGHGSSTADSHLGFVDVTQSWQAKELEPYQQLLTKFGNQVIVMMAHVVHQGFDPAGYPASLSQAMVQDLLRNKLQFNGVVVSDDMQMKAIVDHYGQTDALRLAINAGVDLLIFGNQLVTEAETAEAIIERIYHEIQQGKILESRINEAHLRLQSSSQKTPSLRGALCATKQSRL